MLDRMQGKIAEWEAAGPGVCDLDAEDLERAQLSITTEMETVRLRLEGWEQIKEDGRLYYLHTDGRKLPKWEFEELQSNSQKIVADARRRPLSPEVRRVERAQTFLASVSIDQSCSRT